MIVKNYIKRHNVNNETYYTSVHFHIKFHFGNETPVFKFIVSFLFQHIPMLQQNIFLKVNYVLNFLLQF